MSKKKNKAKIKNKAKKSLKEFDKYYYYEKSVQSAENDVQFLKKTYKEIKGKEAKSLREDFCGTFKISCEWVKMDKKHTAVGVDLDPEPIEYGKKNYYPELNEEQQSRVEILTENVMATGLPKADIVDAQNFSYFLFKKREDLRAYFKNALKGLNKDGLFIVDCFGGSQCYEPNEEETEHDEFSYFWDQDKHDPVTNEALFYIHFKRKGEKKREQVFTYDWRLWSIPEIREIMEEAGFKKTHVYWEGTEKDGTGDGVFSKVTNGEECEGWVAYVAAEK
ncbi:MAG: class I SAM-dependent methyltransferase [Bdellovibrionaceae bacterium]|jgi:SAM-dependent methyltransferase|nr:class I SAM-dependent methyltransferase [Pseudobdellovibrionaceae bacterium]